MPKPFPSLLSIGTDICHVPRIQANLARRTPCNFRERWLRKVLVPQELAASPIIRAFLSSAAEEERGSSVENMKPDLTIAVGEPVAGTEKKHVPTLWTVSRWMAGRWAAKEAVIKAHAKRRLTMQDVWIRSGPVVNGIQTAPIGIVRAKEGARMDLVAVQGDLFHGLHVQMNEKERLRWEMGHEVKISISHDEEYATAVCLSLDEEDNSQHIEQSDS